MQIRACALLLSLLSVLLTGCAGDRVIFVTKTSIGLDVDTTPPNVTIAYDRIDGFYGPRYDNGAVPPVVASIQTDLAIFAPRIRQVYATGNAAVLVTTPGAKPLEQLPLKGQKKSMFFGTSTTVGLKVAFSASGAPESLSLGYKRKEMSVIPLGRAADTDEDTYPSVLATIDMRINADSFLETSFALNQFFATGTAAENLAASNPAVRRSFMTLAKKALDARPAVIVPADIHERRKKIAAYVRGLHDAGNREALDAVADKLDVPIDEDLQRQRAAILDEVELRSRDKTSLDQLSTLLRPISKQDF